MASQQDEQQFGRLGYIFYTTLSEASNETEQHAYTHGGRGVQYQLSSRIWLSSSRPGVGGAEYVSGCPGLLRWSYWNMRLRHAPYM